MQLRAPPRNVSRFAHTPGMDVAGSGMFVHRSGLQAHGIEHKCAWSLRSEFDLLKFQSIISPDFFPSIHGRDGDEYRLAFPNTIYIRGAMSKRKPTLSKAE